MARFINLDELLTAIDQRNGRLPLWLDEILMEDCKVVDVANTPDKAYPISPDFCPYCGSKNVSLDCGICCVNYKDGKEVQE